MPSTTRWRTRSCRPRDRDALRRALPFLRALGEAPAGTRLIWAAAESGDYPVYLGRGLIESGFFPPLAGRRFVVTDENVARAQPVPGDERIVVMPGEDHKTIHGAEHVLRSLAQGGAERGDLVVGAGGGVVGDMAGFCAAVYQRGMRHVQVPTTLVAQVDSAYGGKTGVDLPEGKNYVGAYHQPSAVLCDPAALETLPPEEAAAGYVEVVKTALIAGGPLWARVRQGGEPGLPEIMGCVRTKLGVVAEDERDGGRRQVLNLGHTVGHAIESATSYSRYRHGEAVGIGLLAALRLSDRDALRAEVSELLAARSLPLRFAGASVDEVLALVARDKKRSGGRVPFVLVQAPGEVTPGPRRRPRRRCGPPSRRCTRHEAPRRGPARRELRRARPPPGDPLRRAHARGARGPDQGATPTSSDIAVAFTQTNHEGEYCEALHKAGGDGLILNPGAWTHYSWAIRDALEVAALPAVEVHLSAVDEREEWRRVSVIRDVCIGTVAGKGAEGYRDALALLRERFEQ